MLYRLLSFVFLLMLGCNSATYSSYNQVLEEEGFQGPVKSVVEKSYLAKSDGEKILRRRQPGSNEDDYVLRVSPDGRELEFEFFNDGGVQKSTDKYRLNDFGLKEWYSNGGIEYTFTYDEYGRIKEESGSKMRQVHIYDGPNLVKVISFVNKIEQGRLTYLTDTINDLFIEFTTRAQDTFGIRIFREDSLGHLLYEELVDGEGTYEITERTYTQDGQAEHEKWTLYDQGEVDGWLATKYLKGLESEVIEYDADSSVVFKETITYEFDDYGNWISRLVNKDDEDYYLTEREIKYY